MKKIFILSSLIAVTLATPSFATPTELDKKTVASKAYVDTKQDIIETGNVMFWDNPDGTDIYVPGLVAYDPQTSALSGNKIGILDQETIREDEGILVLYSHVGGYGTEMDNFVPTVRAVAEALQKISDEMPNLVRLTWNNTQSTAINAYNSTFGNGTNQWAGNSKDLIDGQFLANSLALKQNKITTGNVMFHDDPDGTQGDMYVPGLVAYDSQTNALSGNKIGILDQETIADDEGDLALYGGSGSGYGSEMDNYVPTVRAVAYALQNIWNDIPNSWQALSWNVNNDNGVNRTNAINAYNSTFGTGTNNWAGGSADLINGQFLANSLALKQNKITTGLVEFYNAPDDDTYNVPSLVSYGTGTNNTDGVLGNKIGIVDFEHIGADLKNLSYDGMDNFVPTVRAVASAITPLSWSGVQSTAINAYNTHFGNGTNQWAGFSYHLINGQFLANSLALKQNKLPAISTGNAAPTGNQAIVLNTAGYPSNVYTTAGKDLALTAKSGAQKVMNYIDGTTASATFATSQGLTEAQVKSALVSLELLKDVYSELNAKITNNALPTGTTGTVVTYNGVNATTGVQEFGERAVYDPANAYNAQNDATKLATMASVKYVCAGYEPAAAGQPAHDGTHPGDEDYCWLWALPN